MSEEHQGDLLSDVEAFCEEIRPTEELCYLEHRFNDSAIELARKYRLLGMPFATQYGGRGASLEDYLAAITRIGREGSGLRTLFSGHTSIGTYPVARFGNETQKQAYLVPACRGDKIMAFALTEPEAGSNPLEMQMTYRREGDVFILNGVKYLISNGGIANAIVVFAYPEQEGGRISAFIIDTDEDSFEHEEMTAKVGLPTSNTAMFELTDHAVPVGSLLGEEGEGFRIAMATLESGRLSVAAGCLGVIEDCLAETVDYSLKRHQHGKPIARHQLIQDHLAQIELARITTASVLDQAVIARIKSTAAPGDRQLQDESDLLVAEAKFIASNAAFDAADRAVQVFGGRGYSQLFRPARHWADVRVCRIYEGTDEIIKLKIAAALLGKENSAFQ